MERNNVGQQLQALHSSLEDAVRSVVVARNELNLITKLPPETLTNISEFVAEPRTRESVFEIVKMTHVCRYWRSTLISRPHLWSSIFVKIDHTDFVAACLERSRGAPLTVCFDLKYGRCYHYPGCIRIRSEWLSLTWKGENDPCRYHTTISPLLKVDHIRRIHKLDVRLDIIDAVSRGGPNQNFEDTLDDFLLFEFPLPALESLTFRVRHEFSHHGHLTIPEKLFRWEFSPPTELRHLALRGCFGSLIHAARNLTSFELVDIPYPSDPIELDEYTFLPFTISGSPSLVSLYLTHCRFPDRAALSRVTPVKLPELNSLRLIGIYGLSSFPGLIDIPAFKTLSSLQVSTRKRRRSAIGYYETDPTNFLVRTEGDDGFQLFYDIPRGDEVVSDWLSITHGAGPSPGFVRFEGRERGLTEENKVEVSPLPLFVDAKVLEFGAPFTSIWYRSLWKDLEKVGPQLATLRLEVTEGMDPGVAKSVKKLVKARFKKGMPLERLERMTFEGMVKGTKRRRQDSGKSSRLVSISTGISPPSDRCRCHCVGRVFCPHFAMRGCKHRRKRLNPAVFRASIGLLDGGYGMRYAGGICADVLDLAHSTDLSTMKSRMTGAADNYPAGIYMVGK